MKYTVCYYVSGYANYDVEAESECEALEISETRYYDDNFGILSDVEGKLICVEDECNNVHYLD